MQAAERTTHTPGPWSTVLSNGEYGVPIWCAGPERDSAHGGNFTLWTPVAGAATEADCRLISAAPEMLACLEAIRAAYDDAARHGHSIPSEIVRTIGESAAITARAKGWTA